MVAGGSSRVRTPTAYVARRVGPPSVVAPRVVAAANGRGLRTNSLSLEQDAAVPWDELPPQTAQVAAVSSDEPPWVRELLSILRSDMLHVRREVQSVRSDVLRALRDSQKGSAHDGVLEPAWVEWGGAAGPQSVPQQERPSSWPGPGNGVQGDQGPEIACATGEAVAVVPQAEPPTRTPQGWPVGEPPDPEVNAWPGSDRQGMCVGIVAPAKPEPLDGASAPDDKLGGQSSHGACSSEPDGVSKQQSGAPDQPAHSGEAFSGSLFVDAEAREGEPQGVFGEEQEDFKQSDMAAIVKTLPDSAGIRCFKTSLDWFLHLEEPVRSGRLARFAQSSCFELICLCVIAFDAIIAAHLAAPNQTADSLTGVVGCGLVCFYLSELAIKIGAHRLFFFCNKDWRWNIFDGVLIGLSAYDWAFAMATGAGPEVGITYIRFCRFAKLSQPLQILCSFPCFREFRFMLLAVHSSLVTIFWCVSFVAVLTCVFGLFLFHGAADYLSERQNRLSDNTINRITNEFGSMYGVLMSLHTAAMRGGCGQESPLETLVEIGSGYACLFALYGVLVTVSVTGILTGLVVDNVSRLRSIDDQDHERTRRRQCSRVMADARRALEQVDVDGDGAIGIAEFKEALEHDALVAMMRTMELDIQDLRRFFTMLERMSPTKTVGIAFFVETCNKLKGGATSLDIRCLSYDIGLVQQQLTELHERQWLSSEMEALMKLEAFEVNA